ncbi:MAG TPA: hypothetical protein VMV81_12730, partial [Phycisphaerae bacterium]|nr:hypothetical protein [Phycisphaerae bacterium]
MSLVLHGSTAARFTRRQSFFSAFVLILFATAPYVPAMKAGWFFDSLILLDKPDFHSVETAARELWDGIWTPGQSLTILTFSLNRAMNETLGRAGTDPRIFLATNIAIHVGTVLLFYCLLRELARISNRAIHPFAPFLAAAIFAVHPLCVTSVAYIVQRRGELAAMFFLAGLVAFLRARVAARLPQTVFFASLTALCAWSAMHSKSAGATLPVAILALEFCIRAPHRDRCIRFLRFAVPALLVCAAAAVWFLVRINALDWQNGRFNAPVTMVGELGFTWPQYLLTQARAFAQYWSLIFWPAPSRLCIDH